MEKTCRILGSNVHYWDFHPQKKKVIVAVHGFRGTHHGLNYIVEKLPEYRIIIPDLPGFGDSSVMTQTSHTSEGYAAFLEIFIRHIRLPKPPVLLGHSFGSIVASRFAATYPEMVSRLILINAIAWQSKTLVSRSGLAVARAYYQLGKKLPPRLGDKVLKSRHIINLMSFNLSRTKNPLLKKRTYSEHLKHFARFSDREALLQTFDSSIKESVNTFAGSISQPTLLIAGSKDAIVPPRAQHSLQKEFAHASLYMIDETGHLVHYETPEIAAAYIRQFIN